MLRGVPDQRFQEGDLVSVNIGGDAVKFCIIGFKQNDRGEPVAVLKALYNQTFVTERPVRELTGLLIRGKL
ncbi:MAG: hypothetical protein ACM3QZ_13375 [Solirubrobacterales bacterium]